MNADVVAISTDSVYAHKVFTEVSPSARVVNYPILSDRNQKVSRTYCALNEKTGADFRMTVIIDPDGIIQAILVNPPEVARNTEEIIRIIEGLQYGRTTGFAVPADWTPGKAGIERKWENIGKI